MAELEYLCIWVDDTNKKQIKPHSHKFNELVYFKKGSAVTNIGATAYNVEEGTFTIIKKDVLHDELRYGDTQTVCLIFSGEEGLKTGIYTDSSGEVLDILMYMIKEYNLKAYGQKEMMNLKLKELSLLIARMNRKEKSLSKDFSYAINYINNNYKEKIVFTKLAEKLNLSYDYFQHSFKKVTGYSPQNYLINKRLEEAERLLRINEHNCTQIAYICGFSNSAQFSMLFKKRYSVTPREYRKNF